MLRLLVLLTIATIKCNSRSLLVHHLLQNPDIQDGSTSSSPNPGSSIAPLDPWSEFCQEACRDGWAAPECNCPQMTGVKAHSKKNKLLSALLQFIVRTKGIHINNLLRDSSLSNKQVYFDIPSVSSKVKVLSISSSKSTTTLNPWDEFCKEACGEGLAGPECDCPEHLYSEKNMHNDKNSAASNSEGLSTSTPAKTTTLDPWDEFCKEACGEGLAGPECDCPEHLYLKNNVPYQKQSILSKGNISSVRTPTSSTTLDPWDEFCKEACEEGLAGPECDCPEYPIG